MTSRKLQAAEMKRHILDTALTVFAVKGFSDCSIKDLAGEAGISQGLLYHYFSGKEDLLVSAVENNSFLPQLRQILAGRSDRKCREVLQEIAVEFLRLLESKGTLFRIFMQESDINPRVNKVWSDMCREGVSLLRQFILSRIAAGEIREHNTEVTARSLFYIIVAYQLTRDVFLSSHLSTEEFVDATLDNLFRGIDVTPGWLLQGC